jgi:hypothetical protein
MGEVHGETKRMSASLTLEFKTIKNLLFLIAVRTMIRVQWQKGRARG